MTLDLYVAVEVLRDHGNGGMVERAVGFHGHDSIEVADCPAAIAVAGDGQCDGGVISHPVSSLLCWRMPIVIHGLSGAIRIRQA